MNEIKPKAPIRRFDVFAEYNRMKAVKEEHMTQAKAKGFGLWVAKVVAAQKFGRMARPGAGERKPKTPEEKREERRKWHELGGVPQTDKLFDKEIIDRMGKSFYDDVFKRAVDKAFEEGKPYVAIRDSIRKDWKPERTREKVAS